MSKNHEFEIFDLFYMKEIPIISVFLTKYNLDFEDVSIGDTINGKYEIIEKGKNKDIIFGYSKKSALYKVKTLEDNNTINNNNENN